MPSIDNLGLFTWVSVDGGPLAWHQDPEPDIDERAKIGFTHVSSTYIESKGNERFSVLCGVVDWNTQIYQHPDPNFSLVVRLYIDGKYAAGRYFKPGSKQVLIEGVDEVDPFNHSATRREFKFAPVTTVDNTDEATIKQDAERTKDLGLIKIVVSRAIRQPWKATPMVPFQLSGLGDAELSVAEKALKGRSISHGTSYCHAVPCARPTTFSNQALDSHPIAIFNMKYRSRASLHAEMVIPRSPSRSRNPTPAIDNLAPEELHRLARERLSQIKAEKNPTIKREFGETVDLTEENAPQRPLKISKVEGKEIIDLTDD